MYSRIVDGAEYTFGVSGKLIRNTLVMYDRQTGSLWGQILGEAVEGPLTGAKLTFVPAVHTTWADWREQHPDTIALVKGFSGNFDSYDTYYRSASAGVIGETYRDSRLYVKEFVIGVAHDGEAVAYPFSALNDEAAVNDVVGMTPVLVAFNVNSGAGVVYERTVAGETYTFKNKGGCTLVDDQTSSTWDGLSGTAVAGPLTGLQLNRIASTAVFWFGWKDWYPDTRVFGVDA